MQSLFELLFKMLSLNICRSFRSYKLIQTFLRPSIDFKPFSVTTKLCKKDSKKELIELEGRLKRILEESVDPSSPFTSFIDRMFSKPWITFFGDKSKIIAIQERKGTTPLKDGVFRLAFDLAGFKAEEIRVLLSDTKLYIEAKKEETTKDGSKAWREFSYECVINKDTNHNSVSAYLDSDGFLVIEGEMPKETLTGMKKPKQ